MRENLYYGFGNANNATYTYTYDQWGNLTQRKQAELLRQSLQLRVYESGRQASREV
ncbi:MAG: hypothetical protein II124_01175 [Clostridia bacterium]|nr:hypothetical protein [Clostridia bacterium]